VQAVDACPGMLTLHPARDGEVARIRLPGGYVTHARWAAIAALAREFGDGNVDITARGNVQLRGLSRGAAGRLARQAGRVGLLPSGPHDRARNITASPLGGLGHRPPLRRLIQALDAAIVADPALAALPGRFVFAVDDGTGGAGLARCDIGLRRTGRKVEMFIAGRPVSVLLPVRGAVPAAMAAARAAVALGVGTRAARIRDLPGAGAAAAIASSVGQGAEPGSRAVGLASSAGVGAQPGSAAGPEDGRLPLGAISFAGRNVLIAGARLGRLSAAQVSLTGSLLHRGDVLRLAAAGRIVLPLAAATWPAAAAACLADSGLLTSDDDSMSGVSACSGMACTRSVADVRALARPLAGHPRTHWAGCARGCGAPSDAELVVAGGPDRFLIGGQPAGVAIAGAS
jgi:precorrin-3B synthase